MSDVTVAELGVDPSIVSQRADTMSGAPVFPGTRVPVRALLDYLVTDKHLSTFLYDFPTVTEEKAVKVLELAFERTIGPRDSNHLVR